MQWGAFLPLATLGVVFFDASGATVWAGFAAYRVVQAAIFASSWRGSSWTRVVV